MLEGSSLERKIWSKRDYSIFDSSEGGWMWKRSHQSILKFDVLEEEVAVFVPERGNLGSQEEGAAFR